MQAVNDYKLFTRRYDPFAQLQETVGLGWLRRGVLRGLDLRSSGYSNTDEDRYGPRTLASTFLQEGV